MVGGTLFIGAFFTFVILKIIEFVLGLGVSEDGGREGLAISLIGEGVE